MNNGCNDRSYVGGGSSVQDRKNFFENRINEQKQRENSVLSSPSMSSCTSQTAFSTVVASKGQGFVEERTDSESLFHNISDRTEPDPSFGTFGTFITKSGSDSESDIDPSDLLEQESLYYASKENAENRATNIWDCDEQGSNNPLVRNTVCESESYIEKSRSLDDKLLPFSDDENEDEQKLLQTFIRMDPKDVFDNMNDFEKFDDWPASNEMFAGSAENQDKAVKENGIQSKAEENSEDTLKSDGDTVKSIADRTKIKIVVTRKVAEDEYSAEIAPTLNSDEAEVVDPFVLTENTSIDEMITEFQQASSQLPEEFYNDSGVINSLSDGHLDTSSNQVNSRVHAVPINDDPCQDKDEIVSCDSLLALDALISDDFDELAERYEKPLSKDVYIRSDYICPSESTDYSVDSKGNSKGTKSTSSRSGVSVKNTKRKGNGMGKILKKATKGVGKSVKNLKDKSVSQITQIKSVVKNSMKAKTVKEHSTLKVDEYPDKDSCKQKIEFFDEQLAKELLKEEKGISRASRCLVDGRRILSEAAELKKSNDLDGSKELVRKGHTYAYVGRQSAKQYLVERNSDDIYEGTVMTSRDLASAVNNDGISAFEDFFLSFLQCVGPCDGDENQLMSIQVDETLDILSKLSTEETNRLDGMQTKNIDKGADGYRKEKIRVAIKDDHEKNTTNDGRKERGTPQSRNLAIRRFLYDLQLFYETDTYLNLSTTVFKEKESSGKTRRKSSVPDDDQRRRTNHSVPEKESVPLDEFSHATNGSYLSQYSESLNDGRDSLHSRSYSTAGSVGKEELPSTKNQRDRKPKGESLEDGIRVGTVLSISVQQNDSKKKKTRKWFAAGGRKQKA
mmetsp:Transcript_8124/g.24008  ORF Transcript_8124/g.24008 Transcript_8124/m.24008 type:complete len:848 (+) Transcript_8124:65-2608(+)